MGDNIRVPIGDLKQIATDLRNVKSMLEAEQGKNRIVNGLDKHGTSHIPGAEGHFQDEWKTSIKELLEGIGGLGETSDKIADGFDRIDTEIGNAARDGASKLNLHQ